MSQSSWPNRGQYAEVITHPGNFLSDPVLKKAATALNASGLPLPWSGQFAVVFRLSIGNHKWALRCFTSPVSDQQERYAALSQALHTSGKLACLVDFDYFPKGILVNGVWYPLLRMEWAEGQTLDRVVEQQVTARNRDGLRRMAETFREMVRDLASRHIAHGDLQHENILVCAGKFRLVDYDSTFVPALRGRMSLETGLSHYQHPDRGAKDFNERLDAFSTLVIYLSLRALAIDPNLWQRFHDDKNLIFKENDFKPGQSPLLQELKQNADLEIRTLAAALEKACRGAVAAVPTLEEVLKKPEPRPASVPAPDWAKLANPLPRPQPGPSGPRKEKDTLPSWLDPLQPAKPSTSQKTTRRKRKSSDQKPPWMDGNDPHKGK
jgi:hypothetical protein